MSKVTSSELEIWRAMPVLEVLSRLDAHFKADRDFVPTKALSTRRFHVGLNGCDWEFLVTGNRWFDTRAQVGGGGAVDLVMHVFRLKFKQAVALLRHRLGVRCAT